MTLKNKKILVTGGSGFIGSHLTLKLKTDGALVDNFDLSGGQDIQNEKNVQLFIKKGYDIIFHLAGLSGSVRSNINREETFKINTFATVNILDAISQFSKKTKFIISSSRLEYGKAQYLPVDEKHPTFPTTIYGLSKLAATQMALIYHKKLKIDVTIFRTSNVYGPHKSGRFTGYNVINYFIDQAFKNRKLTIFGDGKQKRDYIYIDDLIEAFILASLSTKSSGQIYNLGLGKPIQLRQMASLITKKIKKGKIKFVKWPKDFKDVETGDYVTDITKIKKNLGFVPKYNFADGLEKTLENLIIP